uniref:F-box domain-containing protein n=1 Tax=Oryza nivara TaxID=4536 RepID=A0A0E0HYB9_ORYNI
MADGGGGGGDLLSALPDDVLHLILLRLRSAAAAARISVLARRWRSLWTTLPELRFPAVTDLARVTAALLSHDAPLLHRLELCSHDPAPHEVAAVLHLAARSLAGKLLLDIVMRKKRNPVAAAAAGIGAAFHIPCFRKATDISIRFAYLTIRLPPFGVFAKLSVLRLTRFRLDDSQCDHLGDIVSSERCPSLQALTLRNSQGLSNQPSAPRLSSPLSMVDCEFLMEDMNTLPAIEILSLRLITAGHAFGPCVFQLLRTSTGVRELHLDLDHHLKGEVSCSSGCICYKPSNWESMDICLNFLQKVEINNLSGAEYEICFVKRLLTWTPVLKMITVMFGPSVTVSEEVCQELLSFSRRCSPGICMEIYLHGNRAKVMYRAVNLKRPRDD